MSADVLRRAAVLMREQAAGATEAWGADAWHHVNLGYNDARGMTYDVEDVQGLHVAAAGCEELAEHIASWHPAVALAVADWLDAEVARYDFAWELGETPSLSTPALTVARAYLGES